MFSILNLISLLPDIRLGKNMKRVRTKYIFFLLSMILFAYLNPFIFINKNRPLTSLTVPTNLKHEKFAAGIWALAKGGNDPYYSTAVVRDLGTKEGMTHFILQQLWETLGKKAGKDHFILQQLWETSECPLHSAEVNSNLLDPSSECSAKVRTTCNENKAVCCMFSRPIHNKCFFFYNQYHCKICENSCDEI